MQFVEPRLHSDLTILDPKVENRRPTPLLCQLFAQNFENSELSCVHRGRTMLIKSPAATLGGVMVFVVRTELESCNRVYLIARLHGLYVL